MKRTNWHSLARAERHALETAGYSVWEEHPWHWVVSRFDSPVKVHVWPTSGKVMVYFDIGASLYTNKMHLLEFLERAFTPVRMPEATEDQIEFQKEREKLSKSFQDDWGKEDEYKNAADIDMI